MADLFVDPHLEYVIKNRLLYSIEHEDDYKKNNLPIQTKYVVFGQPMSQKEEGLFYLLEKYGVTHTTVYLEKDTTSIAAGVDADVVIVVYNGHLLPTLAIDNYDDHIIIVLNDFPPNDRRNHPEFWEEKFDYRISYALPDETVRANMFKRQFEKFGQHDRIPLKKEDYEYLAESAEDCTFTDIQKFCKRVCYDVFFDNELVVDLDKLKESYLHLAGHTGEHTIVKESGRRKPKRTIQHEYMDDMPCYKKNKN